MAANVIDDVPAVVAYAGIAFPFSVLWALTLANGGTIRDALQRCRKPLLFVQGDRDTFTSRAAFEDALATLTPTATVQWLLGCDHFFFNRESEVIQPLLAWLTALQVPVPVPAGPGVSVL